MNDLRMLIPPQWLANGAVMIVCDGGYISQYTGIKASLDRYGYKATVAVSAKYHGDSNYMTTAQLKGLFDEGGYRRTWIQPDPDGPDDGGCTGSAMEGRVRVD